MIGYDGKQWVAYFWFVGWNCLSIGFHICTNPANIEVHVPFGFVRVGRQPNSRPWFGYGWKLERGPNW